MKFKPNYVAKNDAIIDCRNIYKCIMLPQIYQVIKELDYEVALSKEPVPFKDISKLHFKKISKDKSWGKELFDCAWFHVFGSLNDVDITEDTYLAFDINGEALLVDKSGEPIKGFTNGSSVFDRELGEPGKAYYPLKGLVKDNSLDLYFDCGYNDLFGNICEKGLVKIIAVVKKNDDIARICYDYDVLLTLLECIDRTHPHYQELYDGLVEVRDLFWHYSKDKITKARVVLDRLLSLKDERTKKLPVFYAYGHAHLDLAWLWPIRESKRKAVRTLSNVFYLIEKYKDFRFVISQPQQLIWIKEASSKMFEKIKEYEKLGRIEIVGGAFVEFDTNVSGEEQLVRQMLYGQKYWLENFGHYVNNLWLPDTFGYNGNLPQLIKQGGMDYFMTIKISWNRFNTFPYHDFIWQGIDGSEVIAHLPPEGTYNSGASPKSLLNAMKNVSKDEMKYPSMMIYGIGDGAGGPGEEHLERIERMNSTLGLNKIVFDSTDNFFKKLEDDKDSLPVYKGELYLENHNGTYTSQSFNKQYNRRIEQALKRLELYLALNGIDKYEDKIDELYKRSLLLEFHDILPGSSIKRVYDESKIEYLEIEKEINQILKKEMRGYKAEYSPNTYVFNHLNYKASRLYKFDNAYYQIDLKPFGGSKVFKEYKESPLNLDKGEIISDNFKIRFAKDGYIDSIVYLKTNKELVKDGANRLWVFLDHGDGWNIKENYRNQEPTLMTLTSRDIKKYGKIYEINSTYVFKNSSVKERIIIDDSQIITFKHVTDWRDVGYMLRSNFNLSINSDNAVCDIQFGKITRSRKNKTLAQIAQYEVCAQQYIDVHDSSIGAALMNKTKCGYYIKGNDLELNLLRSTNYPCVNGDIGVSEYEYALYIHEGNDNIAKVDKIAYIFNSDFLMSKNRIKLHEKFTMKNEDLECSCIKKKYHGDGLIIRLYERNGKYTSLDLSKTSLKGKRVTLVNFLESENGEKIKDNIITFAPFEVKTLWIQND